MRKSSAFAVALFVCASFTAAAAECLNPIAAWGAPDGTTGAPLRFTWFLEQPPLSQTITGHDFDEPVVSPTTSASTSTCPGNRATRTSP